jgi:type VI secretion system protein ImpH
MNALPASTRHERTTRLWQSLQQRPQAFDLFQLLRRLDALSDQPSLGNASRPGDEPLRIGQEPSLGFASSEIFQAQVRHGRPHLSILGFGLFGPNGPLPLHLTEYVRERKHHHNDPTLSAFADLFHHRLTLLFYRAWAQAEAVVSLDRPQSGFPRHLASLLQLGGEAVQQRNSVAQHAKLAMAGHLARQTRNPEGLVQILRGYFDVPVAVEEHVAAWIELDPGSQIRIGSHRSQLGGEQLLGTRVRDAQSRFRLILGPMPWSRYRDFLPGAPASLQLRDWVRQYVGFEYAWDVSLLLEPGTAPSIHLDGLGRVGYGSWLGQRRDSPSATDLNYDPERYWQSQEFHALHPETTR